MTIGTLREKSLHAALKRHYARPGDEIESMLDGYCIDIRRGKGKRTQLIEIQTRSFSNIKPKLAKLLPNYRVTLVHPIAAEKWILRYDTDGVLLSRRRSPKRGQLEDLFSELVSIPKLALHPNLKIEIVLTREEEIQREDGRGSWRRKGRSIYDRRLLEVVSVAKFARIDDWLMLLPEALPAAFTNLDIVCASGKPRHLVQKMTYCLRHMGVLEVIGKRRRANVFGVRSL